MALALKYGAPIYVEEIVMKKTIGDEDEEDWKKRLEDLDLESFGNFKFS
jgi:bifunctional DNase/RNase